MPSSRRTVRQTAQTFRRIHEIARGVPGAIFPVGYDAAEQVVQGSRPRGRFANTRCLEQQQAGHRRGRSTSPRPSAFSRGHTKNHRHLHKASRHSHVNTTARGMSPLVPACTCVDGEASRERVAANGAAPPRAQASAVIRFFAEHAVGLFADRPCRAASTQVNSGIRSGTDDQRSASHIDDGQ